MNKRTLYTLYLLLTVCITANAQGINFKDSLKVNDCDGNIQLIPTEFTYNGKAYLEVPEYVPDNYDREMSDSVAENHVTIYNDELDLVTTISIPIISYPNGDGYEHYSFAYLNSLDHGDGDGAFAMSQTFFNDDEDWEYIRPDFVAYDEMSGFSIMSSNGNVLQSVTFDNVTFYSWYKTAEFFALNMDGKNYLIAAFCADNYHDNYCFYKIDKGTSSVKQVGNPVKVRVNPTIARRSEPITVQLDGDFANAHSVNVVDTSGRTVYRTNIAAGQSAVSIDSSRLSQGLNIVTIQGENGTNESCKIYVK